MGKIIEVLLRSVVAVIFSIAAVIGAVVAAPFVLISWVNRLSKNLPDKLPEKQSNMYSASQSIHE
jgi:predicted PurR-regulated permease PerM